MFCPNCQPLRPLAKGQCDACGYRPIGNLGWDEKKWGTLGPPAPPGPPANYAEYLKSEWWLYISDKARTRDCKRCMLCNSTANIEVHHRDYSRIGTEDELFDLTTLCHKCHKWHHALGFIAEALRS